MPGMTHADIQLSLPIWHVSTIVNAKVVKNSERRMKRQTKNAVFLTRAGHWQPNNELFVLFKYSESQTLADKKFHCRPSENTAQDTLRHQPTGRITQQTY